jgi:hypothetical protein
MNNVVPAGWSKTIRDLLKERSLGAIRPEEFEWARSYEKAELRKWARFPKAGDRYEAISDTQVDYLISWRAPLTSGGSGVLPQGTVIQVADTILESDPISIYAEALEKEKIEAILVPRQDVRSSKYIGYYLAVYTADLNNHYRLLSTDVAEQPSAAPAC